MPGRVPQKSTVSGICRHRAASGTNCMHKEGFDHMEKKTTYADERAARREIIRLMLWSLLTLTVSMFTRPLLRTTR